MSTGTDTGILRQACASLGHWLAVAETLLAQADQLPTEAAALTPFSRPPWNQAVATALFDAHAAIRQLESDMRAEVSGTLRRCSPRSGNTGRVLAAISAMEVAVSSQLHKRAVKELNRLSLHIRQLPAVDESLRWEHVRTEAGTEPPKCPYCECFSLRVAITAGLVACFNPDCADEDGERPTAKLDISRLDGSPVLVWGQ